VERALQGRRRTARGTTGLAAWLILALLPVLVTIGAGCSPSATPTATDLGTPNHVERGSIRVVYWGDAGRAAERTLNAAHAPLPLPGLPGHAELTRSTIYLAPTPAVLDSLAGGRTPDWAAGVAIPAQQVIILPLYGLRGHLGDPVVTLRHELAHIALNAHLDAPVPRWFDEGYATWVSGGWDEGSGWQIRLALMRGRAPELDSLTLAWPRAAGDARLAYLLSASAVRHLATSRGEPAFAAFIESWRQHGNIDAAMRSVYQMTPSQFEREWRAMVRRRYGWLLALSQTAVFWFGAAVLVLLLGTLRRKRNREKMEELRREEYMIPSETGEWSDEEFRGE
jgi:hypothetical protein